MNGRLPIVSPRAALLLLGTGLAALGAAAVFARSGSGHAPERGGAADWVAQLAALRGATPEAAQRAESAAGAARAELESADQFAARLRAWSPEWHAECRASEQSFGIESRRYLLTSADPSPHAWGATLALLAALADEPGITVDQLALTAAPAGDGAFTQLAVALTVRLRP
jgi:hypothetical protein